jgi:hypothetical protein
LREPQRQISYVVALAWVLFALALYGFQLIELVGELG